MQNYCIEVLNWDAPTVSVIIGSLHILIHRILADSNYVLYLSCHFLVFIHNYN
jgi:hypothetical protein